MKALMVYFSITGKTGMVAKELKKHFNFHMWEAGIRRIKAKKNFLKNLFCTIFNRYVEIGYGRCNIDEYDILFIGTPVWAGKPNAALLTFIDNLPDCSGKKFVCFSVSYFGKNNAVNILKKAVENKKGTVIGTYSFKSKNLNKNTHNEVQSFLDQVGVLEKV